MNDPFEPAVAGAMAAAKSPAGLADAVRDQANSYVERRKGEAAGFIADLAMTLRNGGGALQDGSQTLSFVHTLADSLSDLSVSIDRRSLGELYRDVEVAARRNPLATVALTAAAGYGAFHVLHSKGTHRH